MVEITKEIVRRRAEGASWGEFAVLWSGSDTRLKRDLSGSFGSASYPREELRAEIAQVMICAELGISDCDFTNGAAYVAQWVSKLRDDKREVFRATADAQWIADFLLAFHLDFAAKRAEPDAQPAARSRSRDEVTMRVRAIPPRARAGGVRSRSPIPRLAVGFLA